MKLRSGFRATLSLVLMFLVAGASLQAASQSNPIMLGIDVLEQGNFRELRNKRVGLLTHPAGLNRKGVSSINVLNRSPAVNLVALFGPEHGIYGDEEANQPVDDRIDPRTGLPVFSLYGKYRRPTSEMLNTIDVLVIDLQDLGVRSYTYISSMRYAVEACFTHGVEVVILDRPNPLGGQKVDGPILDPPWMSFVGAFEIPYVHGLTIGELALMSKAKPGWYQIPDEVRRQGKLTVIPMKGWSRDMLWTKTGLNWKATSPNIPDLSSVLGYAMTGLGQMHSGFSHGIGTPYPFRLLRHSELEPEVLKGLLEERGIPGLEFRLVPTKTRAGAPITGVYVLVSDWNACRPTEISFHMMTLGARLLNGNPYQRLSDSQMTLFNKHVGSTEWWDEIRKLGQHARLNYFLQKWEQEARTFQNDSRKYWLYR